MVYSSTSFLFVFFPVAIFVYFNPLFKVFKGNNIKIKNYILLLLSLWFYAWGEPIFVFVLLISVCINWIFGLLMKRWEISPKSKKLAFVLALVFNIGLLFVFKYLSFVMKNVGVVLEIALPIGISFFTFQAISYLFDTYRNKVPVQKNLLNLGVYLLMFPQLIAGPIIRYEHIQKYITSRKTTLEDFYQGITRFIFGLGKKMILASYLGIVTDNIFKYQGELSVATAWLGAICYTLQIYFDFSGYSDMAIGLARIFGFNFPENFNFPYIARSISDFWRRWHISLSSWFRDYVYIPLGGNRVKAGRQIVNLLVVWLLTGFWHGAEWTFLCWGLIYFLLLVIEKFTKITDRMKWFSHIYTMFFVVLAWVVFRAESMGKALSYLGAMFGVGKGVLADPVFSVYFSSVKWVLLAGILLAGPIAEKFLGKKWFRTLAAVVVFMLSIILSIKSTYNPFIYFDF